MVLSYDARGNLSQSGSNVYTYTAENQLQLLAGVFRLAYDPAGRLLSTSTPTVATFLGYDGANLIAEYDTARVLTRRYVHGPGDDEAFLWYEGAGLADKRYLMSDERGSITSVTDGAGAILSINRYDEYGIPAATNIGRFQYTGQTWLPEIGMYNYKARMYSPTLGRFMQADPIGYGDGMNWYNYVGSDPVNGRDPSGLVTVVNGYPSCGFMCTSFRGEDIRRFFDSRGRGGNYGNGEPLEPREKPVVEKEPEIVVTGKKKYSHYYKISSSATCSARALFNTFAESGGSAPGAPAAREGRTQDIVLLGGNPITQIVNSSTLTITNQTQLGHRYHNGTVTIQVSPSDFGSNYTITGRGYNDTKALAFENEKLGNATFTALGYAAAYECSFGF